MKTGSGIPWQTIIYPLVDMRLTRRDCAQIILSAGLPVPPKSSCYFCPFHRMSEWRKLRKDDPESFQKAVELERKMQERAMSIGHRQTVWLSVARRPLDQAVGDGIQTSFDDAMENCESGYCMT